MIREALGDEAFGHALTMQRAILALIGSHRRRTYAHDLVYGIHQLYRLFGKPWHAATGMATAQSLPMHALAGVPNPQR